MYLKKKIEQQKKLLIFFRKIKGYMLSEKKQYFISILHKVVIFFIRRSASLPDRSTAWLMNGPY